VQVNSIQYYSNANISKAAKHVIKYYQRVCLAYICATTKGDTPIKNFEYKNKVLQQYALAGTKFDIHVMLIQYSVEENTDGESTLTRQTEESVGALVR
jgi:hypothetical protein